LVESTSDRVCSFEEGEEFEGSTIWTGGWRWGTGLGGGEGDGSGFERGVGKEGGGMVVLFGDDHVL